MSAREVTDGYPLQWPAGWPRTKNPTWSRFDTSQYRATQNLLLQIQRLGGTRVIISSNVELKRDGTPYANRVEPKDKGVAVYFHLSGKQRCIPCDAWDRIGDNIHAIGKSIEAMRGLERWGAKTIMDRAFDAFAQLPAPEAMQQWWDILEIHPNSSANDVRAAATRLA